MIKTVVLFVSLAMFVFWPADLQASENVPAQPFSTEAEEKPADNDEDKEETIQLTELPDAVRKVVDQLTAGGQITEVEREKQADGKMYYEIDYEKGGKDEEVTLDEMGKVVEGER